MVFNILKKILFSEPSNKYIKDINNIKTILKKQQELRDKDYNEFYEAIQYLNQNYLSLTQSSEEHQNQINQIIEDLSETKDTTIQNKTEIDSIIENIRTLSNQVQKNSENISSLSSKIENILSELHELKESQQSTQSKTPNFDNRSYDSQPLSQLSSNTKNLPNISNIFPILSHTEQQILFKIYDNQADSKRRSIPLNTLCDYLYTHCDHAKLSYMSRITSKLAQTGLIKKEREGKGVNVWLTKKGVEICRNHLINLFEE